MNLLRLLPFIIRLFPELVTGPLIRGRLIPLSQIKPASDEDLARELNRKVDLSPRRDGTQDSSQVIQLSEAINCVSSSFNNTTLIKEFLLVAVRSLIEGTTSRAAGQRMFNAMVECLRENALRQDTPRTLHETKTKFHRPAVGHNPKGPN